MRQGPTQMVFRGFQTSDRRIKYSRLQFVDVVKKVTNRAYLGDYVQTI